MDKIVLVLIANASVLFGSWKSLSQATVKGRIAFTCIWLSALYSGAAFVIDRPLPNLQDIPEAIFGHIGQQIDNRLKVNTHAVVEKME